MNQTLQLIQLILFSIPIMILLIIGAVILVKPFSIINRRWFLAVFLPFIMANSIALFEIIPTITGFGSVDWRLWLILITDMVLIVVIFRMFQGYMVFGLSGKEIEDLLVDGLRDLGYEPTRTTGEKQVPGGNTWDARILTVKHNQNKKELWLIERFSEVRILADSALGLGFVKRILPTIKKVDKPFNLRFHTMGILYIVLAIIFAVLSWILFFEPILVTAV